MIINYKKSEELHYDQKVQNSRKSDFSYSDYVLRGCIKFYYTQIYKQVSDSGNYKILDYGCGGGDKHFQFAKKNNHIVGIDISSKSIELASKQKVEQKLNAEYLVMDCEKMTFVNDLFDLVLDFGTFSSLNIDLAINELSRVMKKDGVLICVETYGHNPFMKIKRKLNVLFGKRTKWAALHIMKKQNWDMISGYFESCEVYYFHFLVLFLPIFLKIVPKSFGDRILSIVEKCDSAILRISFLQFLAFKTVVVLKNPKK